MNHLAIEALQPGSEFRVRDDDLDSIEWLHGTSPISKDQILAKTSEVQVELDAVEAAKVSNKASTKSKLEALGLTADEIKDTFGI
jgi:hypothetical protein